MTACSEIYTRKFSPLIAPRFYFASLLRWQVVEFIKENPFTMLIIKNSPFHKISSYSEGVINASEGVINY